MEEKERDCWETSAPLFRLLDEEFGFILDAAANMSNKKCPEFFGPDNDDPAKRNALTTP